ncbi:hypothetical protein [Streptomyces sp. E-08]|uniref:hypothetical protein n=1 Tax=Streptomyces sp. E-08 TaxID=3404047 RepID=UPI003CF9D825
MSGTPTVSEPGAHAPDPAEAAAGVPDRTALDPAEAAAGAVGGSKKPARKSSSDDMPPAMMAMMVAVFAWETVSDGHPVWIRCGAALFTLLGAVELVRVVRRRRARR